MAGPFSLTSKPRLTGSRCLCRTCGDYFNSVSMFDKHRVGEYPARRCLTSEEMSARGYVRNEAGFWIRARSWHRMPRDDDQEGSGTHVAGCPRNPSGDGFSGQQRALEAISEGDS